MIAGIEIENFTAFGKLDIPLSPRINVIIGSNGTGKTHLLKAIYTLAIASQPASEVEGPEKGRRHAADEQAIASFLSGREQG